MFHLMRPPRQSGRLLPFLALMLAACQPAAVATAPPSGSPVPVVTSVPTIAPTVAAAETVGPVAIPDGAYVTTAIQVADLRAAIEADDKLTAAEKREIIENAFQLGSHETIVYKLELDKGRWTQSAAFDGGAFDVGSTATYAFPNEETVVISEQCCGLTTFTVTTEGEGFALQRVSGTENTELAILTGRLIFESAPFEPAP